MLVSQSHQHISDVNNTRSVSYKEVQAAINSPASVHASGASQRYTVSTTTILKELGIKSI